MIPDMLRILIVDDDPTLRNRLEQAFGADYEVIPALNGLDALEKLDRVEPDLALLDTGMPCLNGYDTAVSIRKNERFRDLPLFFLIEPGDTRSDQALAFLQAAGALPKPLDVEQAVRTVGEYVRAHGMAGHSRLFSIDEIQTDVRTTEARGARSPIDSRADTEYGAISAQGAKKTRILVIDDESDVVHLIASFLGMRYEVFTAVRSVEAMEKIVLTEPDLLLLDIEMPNLSGYQLSQLLRLNPTLRQIQIIFVTSRDEPEQVDYGYRLGAAAYVTKPFSPEDLIDQIEKITARPGFQIRDKKRSFAELQRMPGM